MKLTPVEKLPENRIGWRVPYSVQKQIEEFCNSTHRVVKIEFDETEYRDAVSCYNTWHKAATKTKLPVKVCRIKDEVYLLKV